MKLTRFYKNRKSSGGSGCRITSELLFLYQYNTAMGSKTKKQTRGGESMHHLRSPPPPPGTTEGCAEAKVYLQSPWKTLPRNHQAYYLDIKDIVLQGVVSSAKGIRAGRLYNGKILPEGFILKTKVFMCRVVILIYISIYWYTWILF